MEWKEDPPDLPELPKIIPPYVPVRSVRPITPENEKILLFSKRRLVENHLKRRGRTKVVVALPNQTGREALTQVQSSILDAA